MQPVIEIGSRFSRVDQYQAAVVFNQGQEDQVTKGVVIQQLYDVETNQPDKAYVTFADEMPEGFDEAGLRDEILKAFEAKQREGA